MVLETLKRNLCFRKILLGSLLGVCNSCPYMSEHFFYDICFEVCDLSCVLVFVLGRFLVVVSWKDVLNVKFSIL